MKRKRSLAIKEEDSSSTCSNQQEESQDTGSSVEVEYEVEKILNKRINKDGTFEYFIKWKTYSHEYNTWEPEENMNCPKKISEYEAKSKKKNINEKSNTSKKKRGTIKLNNLFASSKNETEDSVSEESMPAFENKQKVVKTPHEIIGASESNGEILFLIKFLNVDQPEVLKASIAYEMYPQIVLKFYEKNLNWDEEKKEKIDSHEESDKKNSHLEKELESKLDDALAPDLDIENIMGATETNGKVLFLIKWKNKKDPTLTSSTQIYSKFPLKVMKFYEERISWDQ